MLRGDLQAYSQGVRVSDAPQARADRRAGHGECGDARRCRRIRRLRSAPLDAHAGRQRPARGRAGSVLLGGTLVVSADTIARSVVAPLQLPVGVLTALIGVPVFLWILGRR